MLCFLAGMVASVAFAEPQTDVERRIGALEEIKSEKRLTAIETRLDSIEFIGKGILAAVTGQLVIGGLSIRSRKRD